MCSNLQRYESFGKLKHKTASFFGVLIKYCKDGNGGDA